MNSLMLAVLVFAQVEEKNIPRISKDAYLQAVRDLNRAADLISEDPQVAAERVTNILTSPKIQSRYFECRLLIEVQPSIKEPHDFFPYLIRGKARLAWGKKAALEAAINTLTGAVEDLKQSAEKKVPEADKVLKEAEELLAAKKKEKADIEAERDNPLSKFKPKYDDYVNDDKYRTALNYVTGSPEGQKLDEATRQGFADEVEQRCGEFLQSKISRFRSRLNDSSVASLTALDEREFNRDFAQLIPTDSELTDKAAQNPTLGLIRRQMKTLKSIQARQGKIDEVLASAADALKLDGPDTQEENSYFKAMAFLGSELCQRSINDRTARAEGAVKSERDKLQGEAQQVLAQWTSFAEGLDKKVLERHPDVATITERLGELAKEFPVEIPQLASFNIEKCYDGEPSVELKKLEDGLLDLVSSLASMGRVAIESRQELYTKLISAGTLRRIMEGVAEEQIIRDWSDYKSGLNKAGGPINPNQYGPKVKRVFDRLKT